MLSGSSALRYYLQPPPPPESLKCEDKLKKLKKDRDQKKKDGEVGLPLGGFILSCILTGLFANREVITNGWKLLFFFIFIIAIFCACIPWNNYEADRIFELEFNKTKPLPIDTSKKEGEEDSYTECDACFNFQNYNPEISLVTLSEGILKYLPQNTWIQNLKVLSSTKPIMMMEYTNAKGNTVERNVTNVFDFAPILNGYQCVLQYIYVPEDVKLYVSTTFNVLIETNDLTLDEDVRTFMKDKRIVARGCSQDVIVIDPLKNLVSNWLKCCDE